MRQVHSYSSPTLDAVAVLGAQIAAGRRRRRWTAVELAERAGISLPTLRNVERGVPTVAIGVVLELATLTGVELFGTPADQLGSILTRERERLALLPARVRAPAGEVDDNF